MDTTEPLTDAPLFGEPLPVELMNTVWADRDGVHDSLLDADDLARWLTSVRPRLPVGPTADDGARSAGEDPADDGLSGALVGEFRQLRDALRRLAAVTTADPRPAASSATKDLTAAVDAVNHACAYAPAWSRLDWPEDGTPTRTDRSAHSQAATALSCIAEQATRLFTGDTRTELRACHAPGCVLYFVRSHPRREWCSAACGNRARVARHYHRHHAPSAGRTGDTANAKADQTP
jgi:predicted RNA-binding Zn ribbon-like protein